MSPLLTLGLPTGRSAPLRWAASIVFDVILGVPVVIEETSVDDEIVLSRGGRSIVMPSLFPVAEAGRVLLESKAPSIPLPVWTRDHSVGLETKVVDPLPLLYGLPGFLHSEDTVVLHADLLGAAFFMLSRFEEIASPVRDGHNRFPGVASLAWREKFLYRPIIDEYSDLLWALMKRLWPDLVRRPIDGQVRVTCDVDQPFDRVGRSPGKLLRSLAGDICRRQDIRLACRRTRNFVRHRKGDLRFDPYYRFEWYIDACEKRGRSATFYFIADHTAGAIDGSYHLEEPRVRALLAYISGRGHEIGMHGSYNTYRDPAQIIRERNRLVEACVCAGADGSVHGNRQHYLRWDAAVTPDYLDEAGFEYDASGAFADRPGFRYGTAHSFPMWSWKAHVPLRLRQRPLVVMESSVISPTNLGLGYSRRALELMLLLKQRAINFGGDFNLLWHNSHLLTRADERFFCTLIG